jgi:hypothetical protein
MSEKRKDETSRDIGIASLPLRACRPSGGFVLGTLSAAEGLVKRFWQIHFHRMWTTVWKRCAPLPGPVWTTVLIGSGHAGRHVETCATLVSSN